MVDALERVYGSLKRGGVIVDVRPSTDRLPRVEHAGRVVTVLLPKDQARHRQADAAMASLVSRRGLRLQRAGHFWYRHTFPDRASTLEWIRARDDWQVAERRIPKGRNTLRRAVEFAHYKVSRKAE